MPKPHKTGQLVVTAFLLAAIFLAVDLWPVPTAQSKASAWPVPPNKFELPAQLVGPPVSAQTWPDELTIPAIGLAVPLTQTGLDASGHLMVPADPTQAGWYDQGPNVGQTGTALITGHMNSVAGPGVFYNLKQLKANDEIQVSRADGSLAIFKVAKLESYPQDSAFPWNLVYDPAAASPSLRLITCDGTYNRHTKTYSRDLVVYASLLSTN